MASERLTLHIGTFLRSLVWDDLVPSGAEKKRMVADRSNKMFKCQISLNAVDFSDKY